MVNQLSANKAFYLLSGTAAVVFILLLGLMVKIVPLTVDHTVYYCQQFMNGFHFSLPHEFPSLLRLLLILILTAGLLLFTVQFIKTGFFIKRLLKNKISQPKKLKKAAFGLEILDRVDVVRTTQSLSFCYGLLKPRICLSLNLANQLTGKELRAVLVHESYHLKNRDPLKILLSQVAISMFFFIPVLKDIHKFYSFSKEISADKLVIKINGVKNLQSALVKTLFNLNPAISGVTSFVTADELELRLQILVNPKTKIKARLSRFRALLSMLVFTVALLFLNLPVHAMEDPDGNHSYYFMSTNDTQMLSCFTESTSKELPFSEQDLYSPVNYSVKH